jgi:hypothetical protein
MRLLSPASRTVAFALRAHTLCTGAVALLALPSAAHAQAGREALVPAGGPNCTITAPPREAGIAATPGGFVIVFPRNDALDAQYTGCKLLWLADTDRTPRLATLYFERGVLTRAVSHDVRDDAGGALGACSFPDARALLPDRGGQPGDPACRGILDEPLYGLRLATWPSTCLAKPEAAVCAADPR